LNEQDFSLQRILADAIKTFAVSAAAKDVELLYRIAADVPDALVGDAGRLRQVLVNPGGHAINSPRPVRSACG